MIVLGTQSNDKLREIRALPGSAHFELQAISHWPGAPEISEDGDTIEENAAIKAVKYSLWLRREHGIEPPVLAEDSGLQVESLLGWPGVDSKRVAASDPERIELLLERLGDSAMRTAHFIAYTALALNGHLLHIWRGVTPGRIATEPRGVGGFGYDPVFEDVELGQTFAEMSSAEKNARSHRGKAWAQAFEYLSAKGLG
ncbi:non-canonical purine NTP pyrophosphatase [bacterium]|nr:non-canonical purine NTP pyrophosphatase [bacterium]